MNDPTPFRMISTRELAGRLEHTLLVSTAGPRDIDRLCHEAVRLGCLAVCVNPIYVHHSVRRLDDLASTTPAAERPFVVSVAGFPLGANHPRIKVDEAGQALDDGAREIDMVLALGALLDGDLRAVRRDIEGVAGAVHRNGARLKVILETGALTTAQIISACRCAAEGEADFVKTSTGWHPSGGATIEHVRLLHRHATPLGVKASGGIRTAGAAISLIEAGASRIGTSAAVAILAEWDSGFP